jgi:hypothetical protein
MRFVVCSLCADKHGGQKSIAHPTAGFTHMTELENFKLLGIALAIGLERGWRTRRTAYLRLLSGLSGILAQQVDAFLMGFVRSER